MELVLNPALWWAFVLAILNLLLWTYGFPSTDRIPETLLKKLITVVKPVWVRNRILQNIIMFNKIYIPWSFQNLEKHAVLGVMTLLHRKDFCLVTGVRKGRSVVVEMKRQNSSVNIMFCLQTHDPKNRDCSFVTEFALLEWSGR
jgi:hypothetical protein